MEIMKAEVTSGRIAVGVAAVDQDRVSGPGGKLPSPVPGLQKAAVEKDPQDRLPVGVGGGIALVTVKDPDVLQAARH